MDPLATIADLEARGVTVEASEEAAVTVYLNVASALVRDAAGSPISQTVSTITTEGRGSSRLLLPGQPVTAVSAVAEDGVTLSDYKLLNGALWRSCGFSENTEYEVTYTHGMATVPADIVDLVCRLAGQELASLRSGEPASRPLKSERIGDYAVEFDTETDSGTMVLTDFQRSRLAARFGSGAGVTVRAR